MKLNVGDKIEVKAGGVMLKVNVEDASKGDVIQAKVEGISDKTVNTNAIFTYEMGKVYEFSRKDIQAQE